jgi:hypothetical protein
MTDPKGADRRVHANRRGRIAPCELPVGALLGTYRDAGAYTDCYAAELSRSVSQAEYVEAFYTTWVFKLERWVLAMCVAKPSTDLQAQALASGQADAFAAWSVEGRTGNQLLMCDFQRRTRSWLMSVPASGDAATGTRLYFGSAVVPVIQPQSGRSAMGPVFRALLGFHKIYSRILLAAAMSRLRRARAGGPRVTEGPE